MIGRWHERYRVAVHSFVLMTNHVHLLMTPNDSEGVSVRAGIVEHPADYRWSSFRGNAKGLMMNVLTPHPAYIALGSSSDQCQEAYRELFRYHLDNVDIHEIRNAVTFSMPLDDSRFRGQIEQTLGRSIGQVMRGRPVKRKAE